MLSHRKALQGMLALALAFTMRPSVRGSAPYKEVPSPQEIYLYLRESSKDDSVGDLLDWAGLDVAHEAYADTAWRSCITPDGEKTANIYDYNAKSREHFIEPVYAEYDLPEGIDAPWPEGTHGYNPLEMLLVSELGNADGFTTSDVRYGLWGMISACNMQDVKTSLSQWFPADSAPDGTSQGRSEGVLNLKAILGIPGIIKHVKDAALRDELLKNYDPTKGHVNEAAWWALNQNPLNSFHIACAAMEAWKPAIESAYGKQSGHTYYMWTGAIRSFINGFGAEGGNLLYSMTESPETARNIPPDLKRENQESIHQELLRLPTLQNLIDEAKPQSWRTH